MLREGMFVRTNYKTGPYEIMTILRDCTCPEYVRLINGDESPSEPHIHLVVRKPGDSRRRSPYYLGGYDEETLRSVWSKDRLYVVSPRKIFKQLSLFEEKA